MYLHTALLKISAENFDRHVTRQTSCQNYSQRDLFQHSLATPLPWHFDWNVDNWFQASFVFFLKGFYLQTPTGFVQHFSKCGAFSQGAAFFQVCQIFPHLEKCGTVNKMRHTCKTEPPLEKCATLGKICHTWKNVPHLEKCATLGKLRLT